MAKRRQYYRGDFSITHIFQKDGAQITIPQHLRIEYYTPFRKRRYVVERNGNSYTNCRIDGDTFISTIALSRTHIGIGPLCYTVTIYEPDASYPSGERAVPMPYQSDVLLWRGKTSDDMGAYECAVLMSENTLTRLTDVSIAQPKQGDFLIFDGLKWVNSPTPAPAGNVTDSDIKKCILELLSNHNIDSIELTMDNEGYLYVRVLDKQTQETLLQEVKVKKAFDSKQWDGHQFSHYIDQPLRKESPVQFKRVSAQQFQTTDFQGDGMAGSGFGVTKNANGDTVLTTDIIKVRKRAELAEAVINQTTFEQGETVFSLAGCVITWVEERDDVYRCHYDNKEGKSYSGFKIGDQARCQRYDASYDRIIKYYWRVVAAVEEDYIDLYITGNDDFGQPLVDGDGIPAEGDNLVHFGSRIDKTRQSVIVITVKPNPAILQYRGVDSFSLDGKLNTKISPDDNQFKGKVVIEAGSTGIEHLGVFGNGNLLRNSGFTGDYLSKQLQGDSELNGDSELFSPSLEHWNANNALAQKSSESASGVEVVFTADYGASYLSQVVESNILVGESYVLSFKAKGGSLSWRMGGETGNVSLTSKYKRYVVKIVAKPSENYTERYVQFSSSNAIICEIQLERGTIASTWGMSMMDNTSALSFYQSLQYIASAINNGSTTVLGGLILSNMLLLGKYLNGEIKKVTAGVNGTYNNDNDVAFWTGGDHRSAIDLVTRFKDNPSQFPTDEEWESLAKFVATHGGDVFLRGYIYALGGLFKGAVDIAGGKIKLNADGSGSLASGNISWDDRGRMKRFAPDSIVWTPITKYKDNTEINDYSKGACIDLVYDADSLTINTFSIRGEFPGFTITIKGVPIASDNQKSAILNGTFYLPGVSQPIKAIAVDSVRDGVTLRCMGGDAWLIERECVDWDVRNNVAYLSDYGYSGQIQVKVMNDNGLYEDKVFIVRNGIIASKQYGIL